MKVWLDDIRMSPFPPRDYRTEYPFDEYAPYDVHVETADALIKLIDAGKVTFISFDHDLGRGKTGYDVAKYIEESAYAGTILPIYYKVHSANPIGTENIKRAMDSAWTIWSTMVPE